MRDSGTNKARERTSDSCRCHSSLLFTFAGKMIEKYIIKIGPPLLFIVGVCVFATASSFGWPDRDGTIPMITRVRSHAFDLILVSFALMILGAFLNYQNKRISELREFVERIRNEKDEDGPN